MDNDFFKKAAGKDLVFMDLETFNVNLNFYNNRPWQVGMIRVVKNKIQDIGFARASYETLTFGIVCIHKGWKK